MALVNFTTYVSDVNPHVDGCPSVVVAAYIRRAFIDLCERAKIWRVPLDGVALVAGTSEYTLVSPIALTEVSSILDAKYTALSDTTTRQQVRICTYEEILQLYPDWPNASTIGSPREITRANISAVKVAPFPDTVDTYTLYMQAAIRPTLTATTVEDSLMSEYRRAWVHGALHELMLIPGKVWFNEKLATYHGKQWEFFVNQAKAKMNKGSNMGSIYIRQRPWA